MLMSLHKQALPTPKVRAAIQASSGPAWRVAEGCGISEQTVWKGRKRDSVQDCSHTPHRLQPVLTPAQEAVAVALRKALLLPLDDPLSVVREFLNPDVSRSGLDRCLRRHGAGTLRDLKPAAPRPARKAFTAHAPGSLPIDVPYLPRDGRRGPAAVSLRGHRPCHKMGLRAHLPAEDSRHCPARPARF